jgi:hypothetical protein
MSPVCARHRVAGECGTCLLLDALAAARGLSIGGGGESPPKPAAALARQHSP